MAPKKSKAKNSNTAKAPPAKAEENKKSVAPRKFPTRLVLIGAGIILIVISLVLLSQFFRGGDPIAAHIPADAALYLHVDLNQYRSADMQGIIDAFQIASGQDETSTEQAQQDLEEELGVNYKEDIEPWLGQHAGLALLDAGADLLNQDLGSARFVAGVQSKNNGAADAFVAKLVANAEDAGNTVPPVDIAGSNAYDLGEDKAVARLGSIVYVADSVETLQGLAALDQADTLAAQPAYKQALAQLPGKRSITLIFTSKGYGKLLEGMLSNLPTFNMDALQQALQYDFTIGGSLSAVAEGLQFDIATVYDEAQLPPQLVEAMNARRPTYETLAFYPKDTILYFVSGVQANSYSHAMELYPEAYQDMNESFDLLENQSGVNLPAAIDALDREVSFGLFPQTGGIAAFMEVGLGFQIVAGTSQDQVYSDLFANLSELAADSLGTPTQQRTIGGLKTYVIGDPFLGQDLFSFGSGGGYAFIGTDLDALEAGLSGSGTSLADSTTYQEAWTHFSSSAYPVFYFDVPSLLDAVQSITSGGDESLNAFAPITLVAGVEEPYAAGVSHTVFIVFIERTPKEQK